MAKRVLSGTRPENVSCCLIGITTYLKDYRITFLLNGLEGINLVRADDFILPDAAGNATASFTLFTGCDEDRYLQYFFLANRSGEQFLFPEVRNCDFLFLIEGPVKKNALEKLVRQIRTLPNVVAAFDIPVGQLRNLNQVCTDLEIHFINLNRERSYHHVRRSEKNS